MHVVFSSLNSLIQVALSPLINDAVNYFIIRGHFLSCFSLWHKSLYSRFSLQIVQITRKSCAWLSKDLFRNGRGFYKLGFQLLKLRPFLKNYQTLKILISWYRIRIEHNTQLNEYIKNSIANTKTGHVFNFDMPT